MIEVIYAPTFQLFKNPNKEFKTTPVVEVSELLKWIQEQRDFFKDSSGWVTDVLDKLEKSLIKKDA